MWLVTGNQKYSFSLPDIIYSCSEVATFTSKDSPHLEINRIKKKKKFEIIVQFTKARVASIPRYVACRVEILATKAKLGTCLSRTKRWCQ